MQASIFTHGIFRNVVTVYGVSISVAVMVLVVYVPFLQVRFCFALSGRCKGQRALWLDACWTALTKLCWDHEMHCKPFLHLRASTGYTDPSTCLQSMQCRVSSAPGTCMASLGCLKLGRCFGCCRTLSTPSAWCVRTQMGGGLATWRGDVLQSPRAQHLLQVQLCTSMLSRDLSAVAAQGACIYASCPHIQRAGCGMPAMQRRSAVLVLCVGTSY